MQNNGCFFVRCFLSLWKYLYFHVKNSQYQIEYNIQFLIFSSSSWIRTCTSKRGIEKISALLWTGTYLLMYFPLTMSCSKTQPPDFPPKGSGHFVSNFLLSAGILAQYKTFHVSFKKYLYFQKDFSSSKVEK